MIVKCIKLEPKGAPRPMWVHVIKLIMRTFVLLFCTTLFGLSGEHALSQNGRIKIDSDREVSVDQVFDLIKEQTAYTFIYREGLFKDVPKVRLSKGTIRLNALLGRSLSSDEFDIVFTENGTILIRERPGNTNKIQVQVTGKVTDQGGVPLPGVTVLVKGTTRGTVTDFDGKYDIMVPDPANVLVFSSLGYKAQEITVGNQATIHVTLEEDVSELDGVVLKGYYKTTRREETGSVASMEAKTIAKQPVNNPLAAMQGHLPGVDIVQASGLPGGNFRIQIRGQNFIDPENQSLGTINNPLYVVDGVPYGSNALREGNLGRGAFGNSLGVSPLNAVNPADIESIEVLKDADATAIYGSRGANGVVLITTKKGKEGRTQVKLNVGSTLSKVTGFLEVLNTEQYLEIRREALVNDGYASPEAFSPQSRVVDLTLWDQDRYTDWQEELIGGTAYRHNAQLSFSGGSERTQFLLSGGHVTETTVFPGDSRYHKTSMLTNIDHRSEDGRFKLSFSGTFNTDTNNLPIDDLTSVSRTLAPNTPALYDDEGNLNWENLLANPLASLEADYQAISQSLIGNATLSYRPIKSLELRTSMGYTDYRLRSYEARPHTLLNPGNIPVYDSRHSTIRVSNANRRSWIIEPQINWENSWNDTGLKLLFGATFQQNREQQLSLFGLGFSSNTQILDVSAAWTRDVLGDIESEYRFQSFFGRINLNHRDRYILNLTGRRDGSSRFGPGKQFGDFGAVGVAWVFSEEGFLENNGLLSFGKLRGSYGITGSDNIGDYSFLDTYEGGGTYTVTGLSPTRLFNPDYSWGETKKLEAALELGLFGGRIFVNMAWYRNRSSNQLINTPLPALTGFSGINGNFDAVVENTGLEIDLSSTNIQGVDFQWRTTFNISANRNRLVSFPGLEGSTFENRLIVGQPLIVGQRYRFLGVDPETGLARFQDYNKDGELNFDDRKRLVDLTPRYFGGFGNTFQYKNLQLELFFQFVKQKRVDQLGITMPPGSVPSNLPVSVLDRWQQVGDQSLIQRAAVTDLEALNAWDDYYRFSDAVLVDASFVRLRSVSLNYRVPKELAGRLGMDLYLQGQNLLVITPYDGADPEVLAGLPPLRQITLGMNLSF